MIVSLFVWIDTFLNYDFLLVVILVVQLEKKEKKKKVFFPNARRASDQISIFLVLESEFFGYDLLGTSLKLSFKQLLIIFTGNLSSHVVE